MRLRADQFSIVYVCSWVSIVVQCFAVSAGLLSTIALEAGTS